MEGYPIGLAVGLAVGIVVASSTNSSYKKFEKQLRNAIFDKEISIQNKNGERMNVDELLELLQTKYKKV